MLSSSKGNRLAVGAAVLTFGCASAAQDASTAASESSATFVPVRKSLDLRAPDITKLYTAEQIERLLAKTVDETIEEVEVEGIRGPRPTVTPRIWGGIAAPFWAITHPTQAWRIFAPLPPDQTRDLEGRPDATASYLEPAAVTSP